MLYFERADLNTMDWGKELETFPDRTVFQTPEWLEFLTHTPNREPLIAAFETQRENCGVFHRFNRPQIWIEDFGQPFCRLDDCLYGVQSSRRHLARRCFASSC